MGKRIKPLDVFRMESALPRSASQQFQVAQGRGNLLLQTTVGKRAKSNGFDSPTIVSINHHGFQLVGVAVPLALQKCFEGFRTEPQQYPVHGLSGGGIDTRH